LDRADVVANNLGGRVLVAHIDGPNTGAGPDIQDPLGLIANGRKMQLAAETQRLDVVVEV